MLRFIRALAPLIRMEKRRSAKGRQFRIEMIYFFSGGLLGSFSCRAPLVQREILYRHIWQLHTSAKRPPREFFAGAQSEGADHYKML